MALKVQGIHFYFMKLYKHKNRNHIVTDQKFKQEPVCISQVDLSVLFPLSSFSNKYQFNTWSETCVRGLNYAYACSQPEYHPALVTSTVKAVKN